MLSRVSVLSLVALGPERGRRDDFESELELWWMLANGLVAEGAEPELLSRLTGRGRLGVV